MYNREKYYAEVSAVVFGLLAIATVIIAISGQITPVFTGELRRAWVLLAAAAFASAGVGLLVRRLWGWYWALAVSVGFTSAGFVQLAAQQRLGVATILVGTALVIAVVQSSAWFPQRLRREGGRLDALIHGYRRPVEV